MGCGASNPASSPGDVEQRPAVGSSLRPPCVTVRSHFPPNHGHTGLRSALRAHRWRPRAPAQRPINSTANAVRLRQSTAVSARLPSPRPP